MITSLFSVTFFKNLSSLFWCPRVKSPCTGNNHIHIPLRESWEFLLRRCSGCWCQGNDKLLFEGRAEGKKNKFEQRVILVKPAGLKETEEERRTTLSTEFKSATIIERNLCFTQGCNTLKKSGPTIQNLAESGLLIPFFFFNERMKYIFHKWKKQQEEEEL